MSDWNFIIAAYTVAWVGLIGYAVRLAVLHHAARRQSGGEG